MKRNLPLVLLFAAALIICLSGQSSPVQSALPAAPLPVSTAPAAKGPATTTPAAKTPAANDKAISKVRGTILKVHMADEQRKLAEWVSVGVHGKRLDLVVGARTKIRDAKGRVLGAAGLKKGESVRVVYRESGKLELAVSIEVLR
jgi:hypothetical protein